MEVKLTKDTAVTLSAVKQADSKWRLQNILDGEVQDTKEVSEEAADYTMKMSALAAAGRGVKGLTEMHITVK